MGATTNEVSRIRKTRDHPDRRAVAPTRQAYAGPARHRPPDVLSLVRPLPRRRAGGVRGSAVSAKPGVGPCRRRHPGPDHPTNAALKPTFITQAGGALERHEALIRPGSRGSPPVESP